MPAPARSVIDDVRPATRLALWSAAAVGTAAAVLALLIWLPDAASAGHVGNAGQALAAAVAAFACWRAARRGGATARGWALLSVAALVWAVSATTWAWYGASRDHVYPYPDWVDLGFIGYVVPAVAGLLAFPRESTLLVSRVRAALDALVIATSLLFVSWATVLGPVYRTPDIDPLTRAASLAYPVVDVVILAIVLTLGLRRPAGARLPWVLLGGGLAALSVTDSVYVARTTLGEATIGTPIHGGWTIAFLLVALATLAPTRTLPEASRRHFSVGLELLPYAPVAVAVVVSSRDEIDSDHPFLLACGIAVLIAVALHQLVIATEKVALARDLEVTVVRRTAERNAADERFRSLVQSSDDAIIGKTMDGTVTSWNPAAERLYGYTAEQMVGASIYVTVPHDRHPEEAEILARAGRGEQLRSYETERVRKNGTRVPIALTVSPIVEDGAVRGVSAIGRDISERRQTEQALALARDEAFAASTAKSEFVASMSHEIRTPMNGVIGLTELLLDTPLDPLQQRYAAGVRGAGEALLRIIDDILDFSRLEADKVELEEDDFDPRQLVEEVAVLLASAAAPQGLELLAYCDPDLPATLRGDAGRIRQILVNLGGNAVKFTGSGEVVIRARSDGDGGGRVHFEVRDTGIGIDVADQARLFEPFSQADASTTRRFGGTGLGLAICRRLVTAMEGEIGVSSELGKGATFWFDLALPSSETPPAPRPATPPLTGRRALVVDDNATNRLMLQTQLSSWGLRVDAVPDAPSALDRFTAATGDDERYDVALLDMSMPGMNGLQLAERVTADPQLHGIRLMLLNAGAPVPQDDAVRAGVAYSLPKPVRQSELHDALLQLCASGPVEGAAHDAGSVQEESNETARRGPVLVVEDNAMNHMVAEAVVRKLGYLVELAGDGRQALRLLAENTYAAVLMDCHMPGMDGFEATRELRRREGDGPRTPVIAMTASAMAEDRQRCAAAGMDDFVPKPIDVTLLRETLDRWSSGGSAVPDSAVTDSTVTDSAVTDSAGPAGSVPEDADDVLDHSRLDVLRRLGRAGGRELLAMVVTAFLDGCPRDLAAVRLAVTSGGGTALEQTAHRLRGAAANVGAVAVAGVCEQLELLGRSGDDAVEEEGSDELLARLEHELDRAEAALSQAVAA